MLQVVFKFFIEQHFLEIAHARIFLHGDFGKRGRIIYFHSSSADLSSRFLQAMTFYIDVVVHDFGLNIFHIQFFLGLL